jgi:hypothetical protein
LKIAQLGEVRLVYLVEKFTMAVSYQNFGWVPVSISPQRGLAATSGIAQNLSGRYIGAKLWPGPTPASKFWLTIATGGLTELD